MDGLKLVKKMRRTASLIGCLTIVLTALVFTLITWVLVDAHEAARRQAEQQQKNVLLGLEGDIARAIADFDLSLQSTVKGMGTPRLAQLDPFVRHSLLFDGAIAADGFGAVFISDETGRMIYSSMGLDVPAINLADRSYFKAHRANSDLGLVVSEPLRSRVDGAMGISLSRRINHADGSFAGLVSGTLKVSYFDTLFRALDLGRDGVLDLVTADGLLISRMPHIGGEAGRDMRASRVFQYLPTGRSGSFEAVGHLDGVRRLYSYRSLRNAPLIVGIGFSSADIYAEWLQKTLILGGVVLLLTALGACLAWALSRELRRRAAAEMVARTAAQQHAAARARLDALFRNSSDMMEVVCAGPDGAFTYEAVNPVWEGLCRIPAGAAIGRTPQDCLPPELADIVLQAWRHCVGAAEPISFEFRNPQDQHDWEALVTPVTADDGKVVRVITVARDMTERNMLEASLRQAQRMEAMGQFTAGVAHDFNNMLQAISSSLEILQEQPALDEEGRDCVKVASGAATRGATLVHRLLAFSRKQVLDSALLCPERLVTEIGELIKHTLDSHVQLAVFVEEQAGLVRADISQLENCLLNLVINARDAMPGGGLIRLRVTNAGPEIARFAALRPGAYVCFSVEDNGAGMTPYVLEHALEPFFTTKAIGKGTGLGLSMVQGFARQSGGDVRISSVTGQGTTVSLWLPRASESEEIADVTSNLSMEPESGGHERILLVDDDASVRMTLSISLREAGYMAVAVENASAALNLLRKGESFDLLITDQSMPGLTGTELIEEVARLCPGLPVILITGFDMINGLSGRTALLRKPFSGCVLLRQVQALLVGAMPGRVPHGEHARVRARN